MMAISKRGFEAVVANNLTGGFLMMRELFLQSFQQHGGASLHSPMFPSVDHASSVPFDGFHRAVTPAVLREGDA